MARVLQWKMNVTKSCDQIITHIAELGEVGNANRYYSIYEKNNKYTIKNIFFDVVAVTHDIGIAKWHAQQDYDKMMDILNGIR